MMRELALVLVTMTAFVGSAAGKRGFEWTLSVWTETLSWTEDRGFHLTFRSWNKPMLEIQQDDGRYSAVYPVGAGVRLESGRRYLLTNRRGRNQFFKVCALPLDEPGFDVPPTFSSEHEVLAFEHVERISRDGKTRHERYVVSFEGDVYDCEARAQTRRGMPMILPNPWTPPDIKVREIIRKVSERKCDLARETRDAAWKELMQLEAAKALSMNGTNMVCYSTAGRFGAEEVRKMTKDGKLSPFLEKLVSQFDPERSRAGKWAQICVADGALRIVGITENFGTGNRRQSRFYLTGTVDKVIDEHKASGEKIVHHYDKDGKWQWEVKMRDNKAFEFWRAENGRIDKSSDLELAQRLAEQATIEDVE